MRTITLLCCGILLAAWTSGTQVDQSQVAQFKNGISTVTDVESKLGQPQKTGQLPNGDTTIAYIYLKGTPNAASYVPFARFAAGSTAVHSIKTEFEFDKSGHLVAEQTTQADFQTKR